jgi:CBS-domain-containing membrane protein
VYAQPTQIILERVRLDSPATDAMTDLACVTAVIVNPHETVDEANLRMKRRGVRLLLVVDQNRKVMGVITADDVSGEKPVQFAAQQGVHRDEVLVRNVMTPCASLQVVNIEQVRAAKVGHVIATLKLAGRQHMLVVDRSVQGDIRLRGIFSATQIYRQLGVPMQPNIRANTFAEIEAELSH